MNQARGSDPEPNRETPARVRAQVLGTLLGAALAACLACQSGQVDGTFVPHGSLNVVPRGGRDFITPIESLAYGHALVREFLETAPQDDERRGLQECMARFDAACVRIELRHVQSGQSYGASAGSGILLADGRFVLTAGHTLAGPDDPEVLVTLRDGTEVRARVVLRVLPSLGEDESDWALLELDSLPDFPVPAVEFGSLAAGTRVLYLGYPNGRTGLDEEGRLVTGPAATRRALAPMAIIGRGGSGAHPVFAPEVGVLPFGGMSGGPILDATGRLLGVLVTTNREVSATGVLHSVGVTWTPTFQRALAERLNAAR
jgi:S1-C subfamily serine protease